MQHKIDRDRGTLISSIVMTRPVRDVRKVYLALYASGWNAFSLSLHLRSMILGVPQGKRRSLVNLCWRIINPCWLANKGLVPLSVLSFLESLEEVVHMHGCVII